MDCPRCHSLNPPTAVRCLQCDAHFDLEVPTLAEPEDPSATLGPEFANDWSSTAPVEGLGHQSGALMLLKPGSVLANRYEIQERLGTGGMGTVYKARDRELDRFLAVKVIRPELAGQSEILKRFKQELILARQVTHRNVIRIFDLGEANGIKFITMEYIDGKDLKSYVTEQGKLSFEESASIIQQVCLALEAAHGEGVVHRDLKPQNIMVDKQGKVSVMDFGIARSIGLGGMTMTGALVGTPEYMSPEQVKGEEVDGRSDLFSVGIILYELLTGKLPYKADTAQGSMFMRTRERALPPIDVEPSIPQVLSDIVTKCLEIDPRNRYPSARAVWTDLEAWRGGGRAQLWSPVASWLRQIATPRAAVVSGSLFLLLVAGVVAFRPRLFSKPAGSSSASAPAMSLAIIPFYNASGDQKLDWLGSSMAEILTNDVGQSALLRTVSADRVDQILHDLRISSDTRLDGHTVERLAEFSNADVVVWGQYARFGDQVRIDATLQDLKRGRNAPLKAEAPSEKDILNAVDVLAKEIREDLALSSSAIQELKTRAFKPSSSSLEALRHYNAGLQLARAGNDQEAVKQFTASAKEDPEFALAYSKLGETYAKLGQDNDAEGASLKAVELSEMLPPQEKYLISATHSRILKEYAKAIESYEELAKVRPGDTDILFDLAGLYENSGTFDKAREYYAKVRTLDPKRVDALLAQGRVEIESGNPQNGLDYLSTALNLAIQFRQEEQRADILQAIGVAYQDLNRFPEALRSYQDSLEIKRRLELKSGIAASLSAIAQVQQALGKPDLALRGYSEALKLQREIGDRTGIAEVLNDLGNFYNDRGEYNQGLKLFKEFLQIQIELRNEQNQGLALSNIGNTYLFKGDYQDAHTYFEQSLQRREKFQVAGDIADTLHNLAETSTDLGLYDQALAQYLRALELRRSSGDKRGAAIESYSMGSVFGFRGRYGAALSAREEALNTFRNLGERSFWTAEIFSGYGNALAQMGRSDEAQKNLEEALNLARDLKNQVLIAKIEGYQGDNFFYHGDFKAAHAHYVPALDTASRTADRQLILVSKANLAKLAVEEGHAQSSIVTLRGLAEAANTTGLKYLSLECSVRLAKALIETKKYPQAQAELQHAIIEGDKLGLRALIAQSHYLLGRIANLTGNKSEAERQQQDVIRILDSIREEAHSDLHGRADLALLSSDPIQK